MAGGITIFFCGGERSTTFSSLIIICGSMARSFFLHSCICRHSLSFFDKTDSDEACFDVCLLDNFRLSIEVVILELSFPFDDAIFEFVEIYFVFSKVHVEICYCSLNVVSFETNITKTWHTSTVLSLWTINIYVITTKSQLNVVSNKL